MLSFIKIIFLLIGTITLFACGGGGGGTTPTTSNTYKSFLSAAPVNGATCNLYKVINNAKDKVSIQTVISDFGKVEFSDITYVGTALIECTGGKYKDEATPTEKEPPALRSVVALSSSSTTPAITPLTEIAYQMDKNNLDRVLNVHTPVVAQSFGLSGIDISATHPTDIYNNSIEDNNNGKYATILAGLSKLEAKGTEGSSMTAVINNITDDLNKNGALDEQTSQNMNTALGELEDTTSIKDKINNNAIKSLKGNITTNSKNLPLTPLNDTGITRGSTSSTTGDTINETCTGDVAKSQDCSHGRDAGLSLENSTFIYSAGLGSTQIAKTGAGVAGFDFTKLAANGSTLTIQTKTWADKGEGSEEAGTKWSCVQDNVTGLIWEVKAHSLARKRNDKFSWYNPDIATNGGANGDSDKIYTIFGHPYPCYGYNSEDKSTFCNTQAYINRVNNVGLCGKNDWRMPDIEELRSIVHYGKKMPTIDKNYFPNTGGDNDFWSSSSISSNSDEAWMMSFTDGAEYSYNKGASHQIRLVSRPE